MHDLHHNAAPLLMNQTRHPLIGRDQRIAPDAELPLLRLLIVRKVGIDCQDRADVSLCKPLVALHHLHGGSPFSYAAPSAVAARTKWFLAGMSPSTVSSNRSIMSPFTYILISVYVDLLI